MGDYKNTIQHAKNEAREEGREEGHKEGKLEGREEGRLENQILTAQNMYAKGFDYKTIADILNVKEREVKKWLKSKG
ncbi:hypothetical protein [Persicobacter sp. CCB-QB2]|uniref:hypothetical protein n=1 Tax=Persicobacter sp. CCB-QB2 TaxID=1561025 RepID=UPI0012FCD376|nr:hypothetical protein [Persicobacter sp. CCB-QB2]